MNCESGEACNAALGASGSNAQGAQFLAMHTQHHGGKQSRRSARRSRRYRMRGGAVAELPTLEQAFEPSLIPAALHASAGVAPLDQANAQLAQFKQMGGRRTRRSGGALGMGPAEHGGSLIPADMEQYAFPNQQWYDENQVNPMFVGPTMPKIGGAKKSRKGSRKAHRKQKGGKSRKAQRKGSRKAQRKSRK